MLSANIAVAGKIASGFPEQALLRNHAPPIDKRLVRLLILLVASSADARICYRLHLLRGWDASTLLWMALRLDL